MATTAALIYSTYAFLFSTNTAMRSYARFFRIIETGFATIFGAIGGKLIWDGVSQLRNAT